MLSGGFFDDDPIFAGHREQMRQMNQMFRDPFGFPPGGLLTIAGPPGIPQQRPNSRQQQQQQQQQLQQQQQQQRQQQQQLQQQLAPMDLFSFGGFGNMFQNMRRMMDDMHSTFEAGSSNPQGQVFSQSTFMSYSNMGENQQPKVYHASSSTTQGPGGVRETRKMVRDSESGVEKMSVGRHMGSRGHVVERQRNRRTGDREENQEYINMDEEEAPGFNREWQEQSRQGHGGPGRIDYRRQDRANRRYRALPAPSQRHTHNRTPTYRDRE